ncbi:helix-turn-helix domain-containing protein [Enterococcus mundtii]|uniref:helix-turn-helix domain-containing protein n=1 Tax=Enterococcus mundtii TaxID=53346 RepID=UPI000BB55353|nr:helix-turn-helix domain-containing protein [Enterococcus mundtii]PJK24493.1 DNA-binding protein [Enterococcus mundtii]
MSKHNIDIGSQIAKYRREKNLSIRKLAENIDMSASLLSQIERGKTNPSIKSLKFISKALDVPMFYFFLEKSENENLIIRKEEHKKIEASGVTYELLSPDSSGKLETMYMTISNGAKTSIQPEGHDGEEIAVVIKGRVKLNLDGQEYFLGEGDSVKILPFMKHNWENLESQEAKVLFTVTPPVF